MNTSYMQLANFRAADFMFQLMALSIAYMYMCRIQNRPAKTRKSYRHKIIFESWELMVLQSCAKFDRDCKNGTDCATCTFLNTHSRIVARSTLTGPHECSPYQMTTILPINWRGLQIADAHTEHTHLSDLALCVRGLCWLVRWWRVRVNNGRLE